MKWLVRLFALFLIMPVIELALLVQVDKMIGFWPTIGVIVITGLLGGFLAKREGLSAWQRFNRRMTEGGLPGKELLDGVIILVAGALLITPGVITDLLGFLGLLPPTRAVLRRMVMKRINRALERGTLGVVGYEGWPDQAYDRAEARRNAGTGWRGTAQDMPRHTDAAGPADPRNEERDAA